MRALTAVRKTIEKNPAHADSTSMAQLVVALESGESFDLRKLYALRTDNFDLVLQLLDEWRLDRHYAKKGRLFDVAAVVVEEPSMLLKSGKGSGGKSGNEPRARA